MPDHQSQHFLIIGAMRSGTTSLYRYIGAHPAVFMLPKEFQFFTDHWDKGIAWYSSQFDQARPGTVRGEATADYLARPSAMVRIAEALPEAKLIASLRNPIDRAGSHHGLLEARGNESRTLTEALDDEFALFSEQGPEAPGLLYLSHGLYDVHLARCLQLFDRDQLHVVIFEEMVADTAAAYRAGCSFLDIDDSYVPPNLGQVVNAYVNFRSLRLRSLTQKLPGTMARVLGRLNTLKGASPPPMSNYDHDRLSAFYEDRITSTEEILKRRLDIWRK